MSPLPKIVGGEEASPHEFPHQVALVIKSGHQSDAFVCGGSLISACVSNVATDKDFKKLD